MNTYEFAMYRILFAGSVVGIGLLCPRLWPEGSGMTLEKIEASE